MLKQISMLFLFTLIVGTANAQGTLNDTLKEWERAKTYTKEYLDAMPDASYSFKPTPEMRSFADQMLHLADANYAFLAAATGGKSPVEGLEKGTDKSKATVTKDVLASYDYVIAAIQKLNDAQLKDKTKLFGRFELTKEQVLAKCFEHQTHHRGQTTVYLRLAGVKPPAEKLF